MTDDEKLLERLLDRRMHHSPGQARDLALDDFMWIKKNAAQNVPVSDESGSLSETPSARTVTEKGDYYIIQTGFGPGEGPTTQKPRADPDELKRMSES